MSALVFLAIVLVVFVLGALVIYFRNRDTSTTGDASIDSFRDEMGALGPMLDRRRSHGWGDRR